MVAEGKSSREREADFWKSGSEEKPRKESCVKYFDALWFCYSPVHQFQEFYCHGQADDCFGHWSDLTACLKQRTKYADQVKESSANGKHPLWTIRSKEEASRFWEVEFDNGKDSGPESADADAVGDSTGNSTFPGEGRPKGTPSVA